MVTYRLIGSAVTDGQGIAHLDYVGSGAGEVDVIASTSHPIGETSLVSNAKEFYDCMFYDSGTTGTVNSRWKINGGDGNITSSSNGTKFENVDSDVRFDTFIKNDNNVIYFWNAPYCIEFETTQITGTPRLQIFSSITNQALNIGGTVGKYKVTYDGSIITVQLQGSSSASYERVMPNARIGFYASKGHSITFKNLKIYPLTNDEVATLFYDDGINNLNSNWYMNSYGTATVQSNGTKLLNTSSDTNFVMRSALRVSGSEYQWNGRYVVEFDIVDTSSEAQFQVFSLETQNNFAESVTTSGHYKFINNGDTQELYCNGALVRSREWSFTNARITLRVRNGNYLVYKNFKIYEI